MKKKVIGLVTTWYPTPENPYQGLFFKEQAFALADCFDYIVLRYEVIWGSKIKRGFELKKIAAENNTEEWVFKLYVPLDVICVKKIRLTRSSNYIEDYIYKKLKEIFANTFLKKIDVFLCVSAQREAYNLQMLSSASGIPYIVSEHGIFPWPNTSIDEKQKKAIEQADLFWAISYDKIRQVLLQDIHPKEFRCIGNLVDETIFKLREKKESNIKTFIVVAACSYIKNYDLLIQIMNRLTELTDKEFRIKIVGYKSNKGYSKNVEELEEKIRSSKFSNYAELIPEVPRNRISELYQTADAFVMTSIQEGMPVSALEAGCCGLPIFSTMCGGVEDYVTDKIGRIYKIIDYESFAQGLKAFIENDIVFDPAYIRTYIVEHFGRQAFKKNMTDSIMQVIDRAERKKNGIYHIANI